MIQVTVMMWSNRQSDTSATSDRSDTIGTRHSHDVVKHMCDTSDTSDTSHTSDISDTMDTRHSHGMVKQI